MFFRSKKSGPRTYLQIVENRRENGKTRQRVIATLGRLDQLQESGHLDALLQSGARFSEALLLLDAQQTGEAPVLSTRRMGPPMIFERLWRETGCQAVIESLVKVRKFEFPMERAIFLTVLHRLVGPGSDRAAQRWRLDYRIQGAAGLQLHQLYRAMAWLGEALPEREQTDKTSFGPRCIKDRIEESLFARRQDLFSELDIVFFDTTSIYFEGEGGEILGQHGHSKDHRPDLKQLVVGAVIDQEGQPICCELWLGNTTDVKSLIPIVDRLKQRFAVGEICIVADRGMISRETIVELEQRDWQYILGARLRQQKEIGEKVLGRAGRYRSVQPKPVASNGPAPLKVKEVEVKGRRYVICLNADQAQKDAADRETIVAALREQLKRGDKTLVGNKGYRKYLRSQGQAFTIDDDKIQAEARYDGKWVLRTNSALDAADVALKYKQLWMVEALFRSAKSLLNTRPIFHQRDDTIRGHGFCSFLALVLRQALRQRLKAKGHTLEWKHIIADLNALQEVEVEHQNKRFLLRSETQRTCGTVFQTVGVALPPTVRRLNAHSGR